VNAEKDEHDATERRISAELQVEAFMDLLQKRYGLKSEDIPSILDDLRWVREHRTGINRITWNVALGILTLAIAGLATAMWEGIKHNIRIP